MHNHTTAFLLATAFLAMGNSLQADDAITTTLGAESIGPTPLAHPCDAGSKVISAEDMDGDGDGDILWQCEDNRMFLSTMSATNHVGTAELPTSGAGWRAIGVGHFSNDGNKDIVFQHIDGRLAVWLMNGTNFV